MQIGTTKGGINLRFHIKRRTVHLTEITKCDSLKKYDREQKKNVNKEHDRNRLVPFTPSLNFDSIDLLVKRVRN